MKCAIQILDPDCLWAVLSPKAPGKIHDSMAQLKSVIETPANDEIVSENTSPELM